MSIQEIPSARTAARPPPQQSQHRRPSRKHGSRSVCPQPDIVDAVRDQHDGLWVRYGSRERAMWIQVADFAQQDVFRRLANIDPRLIVPAAQSKLRSQVAQATTFRPALVAAAPGWTENHFVFGDGEVLAPSVDRTEIIITFAPQLKFVPRGTLEDWQRGVGPIVAKQPLALFVLALAFVGPLMRFVPPDYLSPLFELVGLPGCGKSTIGMAGMSVWAGDPDSNIAGGETWDRSAGTIDIVKLGHCDVLLLLDEAALAGKTLQARRDLIQPAIFSLTNSGARQRYGDQPNRLHAQLAVLSTSNRKLSDLIEGSEAERGAVLERMISLEVREDRPHGALDHVPAGFESAAKAIEALRAAVDDQWGTAGSRFVEELQREAARDEERLRGIVARGLTLHRERLNAVSNLPRVQKCFALVTVAGLLARRWNILPAAWGCPGATVLAVAQEAVGGRRKVEKSSMARIRSYVAKHRPQLRQVSAMERPLSRVDFENAAGFLSSYNGHSEILIPARRFQQIFPDFRRLMNDLRCQKKTRTEGGDQAKLTIKTPKAVCGEGRVYCVVLN